MSTRISAILAAIVLGFIVLKGVSGAQNAMAKEKPIRKSTDFRYEKINISGEDHKSGIFDISVEYDDEGIGWLAYSRVSLPKYVETHLARSDDRGKTWSFTLNVNPSVPGKFKSKDGIFRSETPSLLYDRGDDKKHRWKLFSQRAFGVAPFKKKSTNWGDSWIEYRYAETPEGPWSEPIPLISAHDGYTLLNLNMLHADLRHMAFYNEIGSLELEGTIYLSLDASTTESGLGKWRERKIILISSKDHAKTWHYVGTLTDYDDASHFGYLVLTGSSLVKEGDKIYLLATPSGKKGLTLKKGHDGTLVIEFEDFKHAKLKRDTRGKLVVIKRFYPTLHAGGLSDYDEQNTGGGILFSQIDTSVKSRQAQFFKVFNTSEGIAK